MYDECYGRGGVGVDLAFCRCSSVKDLFTSPKTSIPKRRHQDKEYEPNLMNYPMVEIYDQSHYWVTLQLRSAVSQRRFR